MAGPLRVLIVEDSEDDAFLMVRCVRQGGIDPGFERVETREAMRDALRKRAWDLILCDCVLPDFDAKGALELVRDFDLDVPFIVISGVLPEDELVQLMKAGAHDVIAKNNLSRLLPAIKRELTEAAVRRERRRAEKALRESETRWRTIVEHAPCNIAFKDLQGRHVVIGPQCKALFGVEREEALGKSSHEVFPKELADRLVAQDRMVVESGRPNEREDEVVLDDGVHTILTTKFPVLDGAGNLAGIGAISTDISERKRMEEALRKSEERFKDVSRATADWIWETDENLCFTYISERFAEVTGVDPSEILGRERQDSAAPDLTSGVWKSHLADLEALSAFRGFRYTYVDPKGRTHYWSISGTPIFDADGRFCGYRGAGTDLTAEIEAERALREREQHLRGILENLMEGVISTDENGVIQSFNPAAERMFGYPAEEVIGKDVAIVIPEPYRSRHGNSFKQYMTTGQGKVIGTGPREVMVARKDGSSLPVELGIAEMQRDGSRAFIGVLRDITERKRAEEEKAFLERQLRQSHKMEALGTLAGGIAHDLNNTLVPLLGLTELALEDLAPESHARANLEKVVAAAKRGRNLVAQILAFSRCDEPDRRPVNLCAVISETLALLRATLPSTIEIRDDLDESLGPVNADATQIHQVIMNLGSNAGDAMGLKGGIFTVTLEGVTLDEALSALHPGMEPGPYAKISIRDTGPGMDADTIERIFDPFFTTKPVGEGTGMGLSVAHGVIAAHGGTITVTSEPGRGTTFEIYLSCLTTN